MRQESGGLLIYHGANAQSTLFGGAVIDQVAERMTVPIALACRRAAKLR